VDSQENTTYDVNLHNNFPLWTLRDYFVEKAKIKQPNYGRKIDGRVSLEIFDKGCRRERSMAAIVISIPHHPEIGFSNMELCDVQRFRLSGTRATEEMVQKSEEHFRRFR